MTLGLGGVFSGVGLASRFYLTRPCENMRQSTVCNCLLWGIADIGSGSPSPCLLTRERSQLPIVLPFISAIMAGHRASTHSVASHLESSCYQRKLCFLFILLIKDLSVYPRLPVTLNLSCFSFLNVGIIAVCHHPSQAVCFSAVSIAVVA